MHLEAPVPPNQGSRAAALCLARAASCVTSPEFQILFMERIGKKSLRCKPSLNRDGNEGSAQLALAFAQ